MWLALVLGTPSGPVTLAVRLISVSDMENLLIQFSGLAGSTFSPTEAASYMMDPLWEGEIPESPKVSP